MEMDVRSYRRIVVLTGAGISAESGIPTFRDANGLWENHRIEDVATPEAFEADPRLVWRFYSLRRQGVARAEPNAAHFALARFSRDALSRGIDFTLVTQNVDTLHERAHAELGAPPPLTMHGSLARSRCTACGRVFEDSDLHMEELPRSGCCGALSRPHIVWFGEIPLEMEKIHEKLEACDLFVSIGTSGQVYPAAGFIEIAGSAAATVMCLNKEELPQQKYVDHYLQGVATDLVPRFFF